MPARLARARIERAIASGRLIIVKGRITHIEALSADEARVSVRHGLATQTIDVARIVNCTGPEANPANSSNPLLQGLIGDRLARADALGLGLAVDGESHVISANGSAHLTLYALGALTRGARWEVTAIAELREQANAVARRLLQDQSNARATERADIPPVWPTTSLLHAPA